MPHMKIFTVVTLLVSRFSDIFKSKGLPITSPHLVVLISCNVPRDVLNTSAPIIISGRHGQKGTWGMCE